MEPKIWNEYRILTINIVERNQCLSTAVKKLENKVKAFTGVLLKKEFLNIKKSIGNVEDLKNDVDEFLEIHKNLLIRMQDNVHWGKGL